MFSVIHTVEYDKISKYSTPTQSYFKNRLTQEIIAECVNNKGFDYYRCSFEQMCVKMVGDYIGCFQSANLDSVEANIMPHNINTHIPRTLNLSDDDFLD